MPVIKPLNISNDYLTDMEGGKVPSYDESHYKEGIRREIKNDEYVYYYNNNNKPVSEKDLERIKKLNIPKTWNYVWINQDPNYRIQVIGIDPHNKKQYIYTKEHKENKSNSKYKTLGVVINLMDKIYNVLSKHQKLPTYDRKRVLSTMLIIILKTGIRAGKEFYAKKNKTYGICSLRKKHIEFNDNEKQITLKFKGKKNVEHKHEVFLNDEQYEEMKKLMEIKDNDKLFNCKEKKEVQKLNEFDLNDYIHEFIDPKVTIKDFRTYLVNVFFIQCLIKYTNNIIDKTEKLSNSQIKKIIKESIKATAEFIQHTPTICKSSYIYNLIIDFYINDYTYFIKNKDVEPIKILIDIVKKSKVK